MTDSDLSLVFDNLDAFMPASQRTKRDDSQRQLLSQVGAADLESIILLPLEISSKALLAQNFHSSISL